MEINAGSDKRKAIFENMNEQGLEGTSNGYEKFQAPKTGMVFNSDNEAFDYYKNYGECEGFGVIRKSRKFDENKRLKYVTFSCAKSGRVKGASSNSIKPKASSKTDCKAKINMIVDDDGRYTVGYVKFDHNHALRPTCNQELCHHAKRRLELNDLADISLSKAFNSSVAEPGSCENLTFSEKESRNCNEKASKLRLGVGDAEAIHEYFVRMQNKNSNFFYKMEFDDENRIKNVFWADARSRAMYESFGDVVTFDTKYLTNRYDMPFAPFVGVNHHRQLLLFGCGLLSNEDTETYVWLFRSWLECMRGRSPNAFITDQCMAIQGAVTKVFPEARHRLCLWNIMKKIHVKLGGFAEYKEISNNMISIVYDSITSTDFEENWVKMIETYNLHHNEWLNSLYVDRYHWVPTFVKDTFWAGMSTTRRGESMDSFFDGYVNSKTSLKQFVEQYDKALRSMVEKENLADFTSFNSNIPMITNFHIEKQFQEAYSIEIFKLFQDELRGLCYCNVSFVKVDGQIVTFQVRENVTVGDGSSRRMDIYNVLYNKVECEVKCICRLFEFKGILCRHAIAVLSDQCVNDIPSRYILDRWRKDIKRKYTYLRCSYFDLSTSAQIEWYNRLHEKFKELIEVAMESTEKCEMLSKILDAGKEKLVLN
ncbi:protein FAR1-RELATED SEQUENCE 6-like [Cornus florida]|uniref:protein FAR1-RELATED SEQUENCE 6-like n=1 Tax=Cornus florida TaxID=4283 RepID=UPI0028978830|nr:protein FAR1-RELATED SEQUENCE 6-like [Cornus florida]XP_059640549.1 protein FAR1-RELATED SEQUENCE 6-like [Cornus florida]